jgi:flavin reductase (DIM6/NTAB) family NADH-FMN oxidoreductase RutF
MMLSNAQTLCPPVTPPSTAEALRLALRRVPAAVTVVTTGLDGVAHGMTATAFAPVSLDPPSVLVAINRSASICVPLARRGAFAVNFLGADASAVARAFSDGTLGHAERFVRCSWRWHECRLPVMAEAHASILCEVETSVSYGTHTVLIGRVNHVENGSAEHALLYGDGRFVHLRGATVEG